MSDSEERLDFLLGNYEDLQDSHLRIFKLSLHCKASKNGSKSRHMALNCNDKINRDGQLFIPKENIPGVLWQQNYRQWKAGQDIRFRLRAMRRKRLICVNLLEVFPDFLYSYEWRQGTLNCQGFFELLTRFLEIYFMNFHIELNRSQTLTESGWKITSRFVFRL